MFTVKFKCKCVHLISSVTVLRASMAMKGSVLDIEQIALTLMFHLLIQNCIICDLFIPVLPLKVNLVAKHFPKNMQKLFFYLVFSSRPFTNQRTAEEGERYFFNYSLPLPPASQKLRH